MKNRLLLGWMAGATLLLTGCIPSLNPFYTEQEIIFKPELLGKWTKQGEEAKASWLFEKKTETSYTLTLSEQEDGKRKEGSFDAHLFKIGEAMFLDLIPRDCEFAEEQSGVVAAAMFPGHLLLRVDQIGEELKLAWTDFDWLQKHLEENPASLAHRKHDKQVLLTAGSKDLQKFVNKHLNHLFSETEAYKRESMVDSAL